MTFAQSFACFRARFCKNKIWRIQMSKRTLKQLAHKTQIYSMGVAAKPNNMEWKMYKNNLKKSEEKQLQDANDTGKQMIKWIALLLVDAVDSNWEKCWRQHPKWVNESSKNENHFAQPKANGMMICTGKKDFLKNHLDLKQFEFRLSHMPKHLELDKKIVIKLCCHRVGAVGFFHFSWWRVSNELHTFDQYALHYVTLNSRVQNVMEYSNCVA